MKLLYYHLLLNNLSLFFFRCSDPLYLLEFYAARVALHNKDLAQFGGIDKDFWIRTEDLLMRSKRGYQLSDFARIAWLYSETKMGTNIFWQELEEQILTKASQFKKLDDNGNTLSKVIHSFAKIDRNSDLFWNLMTQTVTQVQELNQVSFKNELSILSSIINISESFTKQIFTSFKNKYLTNNQFTIETLDDAINLMQVL